MARVGSGQWNGMGVGMGWETDDHDHSHDHQPGLGSGWTRAQTGEEGGAELYQGLVGSGKRCGAIWTGTRDAECQI